MQAGFRARCWWRRRGRSWRERRGAFGQLAARPGKWESASLTRAGTPLAARAVLRGGASETWVAQHREAGGRAALALWGNEGAWGLWALGAHVPLCT